MPIKEIDLPAIGLVSFTKRRRTRSIRLTLTPEGGVRVSLPLWVPYTQAVNFTLTKQAWIQTHRHKPTTLQEGSRIGKAHRLVLASSPADRITTRLGPNEVRVHYPPHLLPDHPRVQAAAQSASLRALKKESWGLLPQRLADLSAKHGFHYKSVHVKRLKSRWGSCSSQADIVLNIFLIQLPWELIDYVLLHELVHTRVLNHGPDFWTEFTRHLPQAKQLRKVIHSYQPTLIPG